jgi:hypothetical protein
MTETKSHVANNFRECANARQPQEIFLINYIRNKFKTHRKIKISVNGRNYNLTAM